MDYELMMNGTVRIGMKAPDFEAESTYGNICLENYKGKWLVLFSYPGDFQSVCTTEIISFAKTNTYFEQKNACLLGLSIDSNQSHLAWIYDIYIRTGVTIPFPLISDRSSNLARKYGMISSDISSIEPVRNVYIIDPDGIIRLILVYPINIGRCIPEILRSLEVLQIADKYKAQMPANWINGNPVINQMPSTFRELQEKNEQVKKEKNGISWYLNFKNTNQENEIDIKETKRIEEKINKQL